MYISDSDELIKSKIWRENDGKYRCSDCDYKSNYVTNVKNHIEAHHMYGAVYECQACGKTFKSKNSFQVHKSKFKGSCRKA